MITDSSFRQIGFIGLGVMGEPICRNLARKSGLPVRAHDRDPSPCNDSSPTACGLPLRRLKSARAVTSFSCRCPRVRSCATWRVDPAAFSMRRVPDRSSWISVLHRWTSTRALAVEFAARGAMFIDAPVARTRAAAEAGTLAVMVGSDADVFERVRPLIATFASDITHCGPVGCGQVVKILNNMVLFETVVAISEAKAIGERAGVDPALLFDALSKGSADSFALRNHGLKAVLPGEFPERAFSVEYARKDLAYALQLATRNRRGCARGAGRRRLAGRGHRGRSRQRSITR